MSLIAVLILALVQGLAELLPVSSSAHVVVAEKLMGLKPASPEMTLLLVMLHTGTMFAVIVYFWKAWKKSLFASKDVFLKQMVTLIVATLLTGAIGYSLKWGIERGLEKSGYLVRGADGKLPKAEIELLFDKLDLVAGALLAAGVLILVAGLNEPAASSPNAKTSKALMGLGARASAGPKEIGYFEAAWIGAVQGLCLPFRGFSRSGATISVGMLVGCAKARVEEFSFALAVIITPAAIWHMVSRYIEAKSNTPDFHLTLAVFAPSLIGMVASFFAGLLALRWLSGWLENGRWYLFGIYCLAAAAGVFGLYCAGW